MRINLFHRGLKLKDSGKNLPIDGATDMHWAKLDDSNSETRDSYSGDKILV
jgi:hypothetical protein